MKKQVVTKNIKKNLIYLLLILALQIPSHTCAAIEGFWLPWLIPQLNEAEMKNMGLEIDTDAIWSNKKNSLKDAVVRFGNGCTGSVVSSKGLVFTNAHCVDWRATLQQTGIAAPKQGDNYWASNLEMEQPIKGLSVQFIIGAKEITDQVLQGVEVDKTPAQKKILIAKNIANIKRNTLKEAQQQVQIRPFFKGNQYYLFITETFSDIRLVALPPAFITQARIESTNEKIPELAGDFALFRIYASKDNKPARYSSDNIPYTPKQVLDISLEGVDQNDFSFLLGYPGSSDNYLHSAGLRHYISNTLPSQIATSEAINRSLYNFNHDLSASPLIPYQNALDQAEQSRWKATALDQAKALQQRIDLENRFQIALEQEPQLKKKYGFILKQLEEQYKVIEPLAISLEYQRAFSSRYIKLIEWSRKLQSLERIEASKGVEALQIRKQSSNKYLIELDKRYIRRIDESVFANLLGLYFEGVQAAYLSKYAIDQVKQFNKDYEALANAIYSKTILQKPAETLAELNKDPKAFLQKLRQDYAYIFIKQLLEDNQKLVQKPYRATKENIDVLEQKYMKGLLEALPEERFYPDANRTIRVSYGKIEGYKDYNGTTKAAFYTTKDLKQKNIILPSSLNAALNKAKTIIPISFLASSHTSKGSSGSPVFNAKGQLIGLNSNRNQEGRSSDFHYDQGTCRNIAIDIRYILWLMEQYGLSYVQEELMIIE